MGSRTLAVPPGLARVEIERASGGLESDWVVVEEPLQIRIHHEALAVTLRTPGNDRELAAGFLVTEGLIDGPDDLASVEMCSDVFETSHPENCVNARLTEAAAVRLPERRERAGRSFTAVSACGVCGKTTIDSLRQATAPIEPLEVPPDFVRSLPLRMREQQELFASTGGLHAAALFEPDGRLIRLFEDIGRHNAVDKVIGHALLAGDWPLAGRVLLSSGRAGFEIVQKAARAGIPVLAAVGAASSLAIELARETGVTLYSFVGAERGNRHVRRLRRP